MTKVAAYLDYNAGAPVRPAVIDAMTQALTVEANPSSIHRAGRLARRSIEDARDKVAALAGCDVAEVIFTSGGTEANNLALWGAVRSGAVGRLIVSAVEHDSVRVAAEMASVPVAVAPVDRAGVIDLAALEALLAGGQARALVSVMLANNETGVIQPVTEVVALGHRYGALVHGDAVQAAGRMALDFAGLALDLMTLSAHKIGGPAGVGALIKRAGVTLTPVIAGGGQEYSRRGGTENLSGIVGFGVAAMAARRELADVARIASLRDRLERDVTASVPAVRIYGRETARVSNTTCFGLGDVKAETQVMALDLAGVLVGAGAACSSGKMRPSPVLTAMGHDETTARAAIRVSLGWATVSEDVDRFLAAYIDFAGRALIDQTPAAFKKDHGHG